MKVDLEKQLTIPELYRPLYSVLFMFSFSLIVGNLVRPELWFDVFFAALILATLITRFVAGRILASRGVAL